MTTYAPISSLWPEDVRRMTAGINSKADVFTEGRWVFVFLSSGEVVNDIYETRNEALRFNKLNKGFAVKLWRDGIGARTCAHLLKFHRDLDDRGMHIADPDYQFRPFERGIFNG